MPRHAHQVAHHEHRLGLAEALVQRQARLLLELDGDLRGRTETALATHRIGELIRLHKISCEIRGDDHLRNAFAVLDGLRFCTLIVKGYQNFTAVVSIDDTDLVGRGLKCICTPRFYPRPRRNRHLSRRVQPPHQSPLLPLRRRARSPCLPIPNAPLSVWQTPPMRPNPRRGENS